MSGKFEASSCFLLLLYIADKLAVSQSDGRVPVVSDSVNIAFSTGEISSAQERFLQHRRDFFSTDFKQT